MTEGLLSGFASTGETCAALLVVAAWMEELLSGFTPTDKVFAGFAFVGTLFFFLRVVWLFVAGVGDLDTGDAHGAGAHDAAHGHDSTGAFKLFSINSVTAFIMMFGWAGLSASRQYALGAGLSLFCALAVGVLSMALIAWIFSLFLRMTSAGERFDIAATVGCVASVYHAIPKDGRGKVQISMRGSVRELEAVAEDHQPIESFKNVKIVRVVDHHTVAVARAE